MKDSPGKRSRWKLCILILMLVFEVFIMFTQFAAVESFARRHNTEMLAFMKLMIIWFVLLLICSGTGFYLWFRDHAAVLLPVLGGKFSATVMIMGLYMFGQGEGEAAVLFWLFMIIAAGGLLCSGLFFRRLKDEKRMLKKNQAAAPSIPFFQSDKAKYLWDAAAEEYCLLHHTKIEALTEDEGMKIYRYAALPIACFLFWLIRHDLFVPEMEEAAGDMALVKEGRLSPITFFETWMDLVLIREEIAPEALPFMDSYYEKSYWEDYTEIYCQGGPLFYCLDFSMERYLPLEEAIDRSFRFMKIAREYSEEDLYSEETLTGEYTWKENGQKVKVHRAGGVSDAYKEACIRHSNTWSPALRSRVCAMIRNDFLYDSDEDEIWTDEKILSSFTDCTLTIPRPYGEEPAYNLGAESELEPEHGLSLTIRGEYVLDVSYRMDADTPWSKGSDNSYRKQKEGRDLNR